MLKYRKAWFPKSVSTTFVAHCSLEWRLMWGNIIKKRLMSFAFEKTPRMSLTCKLVPVQYREYEYGLFLCLLSFFHLGPLKANLILPLFVLFAPFLNCIEWWNHQKALVSNRACFAGVLEVTNATNATWCLLGAARLFFEGSFWSFNQSNNQSLC